jgi:hypothetical protein
MKKKSATFNQTTRQDGKTFVNDRADYCFHIGDGDFLVTVDGEDSLPLFGGDDRGFSSE